MPSDAPHAAAEDQAIQAFERAARPIQAMAQPGQQSGRTHNRKTSTRHSAQTSYRHRASGSAKPSLAFDTLYAEGQRR
jgi:hypothetical protein